MPVSLLILLEHVYTANKFGRIREHLQLLHSIKACGYLLLRISVLRQQVVWERIQIVLFLQTLHRAPIPAKAQKDEGGADAAWTMQPQSACAIAQRMTLAHTIAQHMPLAHTISILSTYGAASVHAAFQSASSDSLHGDQVHDCAKAR
jgi:hypothetical protein